tara:strand:- start:623 stop:895 length:273 start_codon:yes stop_codon:yes gene_type:complete
MRPRLQVSFLQPILDDIIDLLARRRELSASRYAFVVAPEEGIIDRRLLARRFSDFVTVRFETIIVTLKSLVLVLALLVTVIVAIDHNRRE